MTRVTPCVVALQLVVVSFFVFAFLDDVIRSGPWGWAVAGVVVVLLVVAQVAWLRRGYVRRIQPTWDEEFPDAARARIVPGGEFVWEPRGAPRIQARHGLVHRWWDLAHAPRAGAALAFDIPDEVPPDVLLRATKKGLTAAKRALPGRGKVRAKAAGRDEPGPTSLVRVRLEVQGHGADEEWARAASEAFARAFLRALGKADFVASAR